MRNVFVALTLVLLPLFAFAQEAGKKKAYYFYGEQCPHCKNVDEYFKTNGIYDKYEITKLDFSNPFNARLLIKFGEAFNSPYKGSVPAVAFDDKFLVGDTPIIENFEKEIASVEAKELPDPEKMKSAQSNATGKNEEQGDKKKNNNKLVLILTGLAVVVAGTAAWRFKSKLK